MLHSSQKAWVSPFMAVTYFAVALTGIILLFHAKFPGVQQIHQWGGVLFLAGGTLHLLLNWRILKSYFKNRKAVVGTLAGVVTITLLVCLFPHKGDGEKNHGRGKGQMTYGNGYRR
jgi:membrane associated rhomboid family serine protease